MSCVFGGSDVYRRKQRCGLSSTGLDTQTQCRPLVPPSSNILPLGPTVLVAMGRCRRGPVPTASCAMRTRSWHGAPTGSRRCAVACRATVWLAGTRPVPRCANVAYRRTRATWWTERNSPPCDRNWPSCGQTSSRESWWQRAQFQRPARARRKTSNSRTLRRQPNRAWQKKETEVRSSRSCNSKSSTKTSRLYSFRRTRSVRSSSSNASGSPRSRRTYFALRNCGK
mmetsp:Transcript_115829/g.327690  ORF Transcript_115829/g.327690 Transcript_115829/m.327690 type:complete len:226 (+) Transcript_115829:139-816(+)